MCLNHFPICLNLKQHCKSVIPRLKKVKLINHQHKMCSWHPSTLGCSSGQPLPSPPFNSAECLSPPFPLSVCLSRDLVYLISFCTGPTWLVHLHLVFLVASTFLFSILRGSISSVQFSSVAQSCLTLCDPMNRSTPGLPVHHKLPEFTQIHVHRVGDAIQPSHPLSSPSPPSQHQGLFQ